ncbi:hypothetical protein [Streptomyces sp. HUAS TT20]|uniref:hypothetical protein n=1 Tax=Streptomyces sp. HUAS TT20 TaxID=3447509 RepID=UPI0021DB4E7E|nr:hypothetical protein [Streptomyces sp. HUAS 15-9]UXY29118.1 hypothetical protein N8I87_22890 [Streptomyces sp. HUAS 15-9]
MAEKILDDCDRVLAQAEAGAAPMEQILGGLVAEYTPFAQLWNLVYVDPDVSGLPEASTRAKAIFLRTVKLMERGQRSGLLRGDMPATWLASTFCGLAETAWELTLEGHMGARQAPDFINAILLHGAVA